MALGLEASRMKITDIKQQKRSEGRFSVYVDDQFAFGLSDLELSTSGLQVGQELSESEIKGYEDLGELEKAYNRAITFLGIRPRSTWEMQEYLRRKGYDVQTIESVALRLEGARLLNDEEFARAWVANRQVLKPRSLRMLEQELVAKRVSREVISEVLGEIDRDEELETLVMVAQKKARLTQYRDTEKLKAYLARQGYKYDQIKKALGRLDEQS
jgi:regulatory protein